VHDITHASRCERGQRARNEDKLRVHREGGRCVAVLADGAGGHRDGDEASRRAVDCVEATLREAALDFSGAALTEAVLQAHAQVRREPRAEGAVDRMHSTVVVLWIDEAGDRALWSHVGDSRLYRARGGAIDLLTIDDSVVQRMLEAGLLTLEQAQAHPRKNQLIAALGIDDDVEPHTVPQPVTVQDGDAFLLCSDGWWGALDEARIIDALSDAATPDDWLDAMQRNIEALCAPAQDNFSAIGVWVGDVSQATRPMAVQPS
jgi:serine/threonine protein phosphatase PrpC